MTPYKGAGKPYLQGLINSTEVKNFISNYDAWYYDPNNIVYSMDDSVVTQRYCKECGTKRFLVKRENDAILYQKQEFKYNDGSIKLVDCFVYDDNPNCEQENCFIEILDKDNKSKKIKPPTSLIPFWKTGELNETSLRGRVWVRKDNDIFCAIIT